MSVNFSYVWNVAGINSPLSASADGIQWKSCGQTNVGMGEATDVGLHALCPGNIPPTLTRFDYFRVFKRKSEVANTSSRFEQTGQISDEERERRDEDRRERAMRDMF